MTPSRRALLAMAHMAPKDLCLSDEDRKLILEREFGTTSSKDLSNAELEGLVAYYKSKGWNPKPKSAGKAEPRVLALRQRAIDVAAQRGLSPARFRGLCRSICRAERIEWVKDAAALERFLAVLARV